jgi:6-phosphofructokinase
MPGATASSALTEDLIDTSVESEAAIAALKHTPGAAFGSCRYKLTSIQEHRAQYERLIEVFRAHDIGFFFYNGGGDSQDTAYKVSQISARLAYPIVCVGIPRRSTMICRITDCSPASARRRSTLRPQFARRHSTSYR